LRALPAAKTCQKFSGKMEAKQDWDIMKNEMPSLLMDEKTCFINCKISGRSLCFFL
jgi:hypothetical protein